MFVHFLSLEEIAARICRWGAVHRHTVTVFPSARELQKNKNMANQKLVMETAKLGKASQIWFFQMCPYGGISQKCHGHIFMAFTRQQE